MESSPTSPAAPPQRKVAVISHAHFLEPAEWARVMWGDPRRGNLGVIPMTLKVAYDNGASRIFLCQGQLEGDANRRLSPDALKYAQERIDDLPPAYAALLRNVEIVTYDLAQNTHDEMRWAAEHVGNEGFEYAYCVTAPKHVFRVQQEALNAQYDRLFGRHVVVAAIASHNDFTDTYPCDVAILEPSHRAGLPKWNLHKYGQAFVWIMRNRPAEALARVLTDVGTALSREGMTVDWRPRNDKQ